FALSGFDAATPNDISALGLLQFTSCCSMNLSWDTDDVGTIYTQTAQTLQTLSFDPSLGCGSFTVPSGSSQGLFDSAFFCLTDLGQGFLLDSSQRASNHELAGRLMLQIGSASFNASMISGKTLLRQAGFNLSDNGAADGLASSSLSNGSLSGTSILD